MGQHWNRRQIASYGAALIVVVGLAWLCVRFVFRKRPAAGGPAVATRLHTPENRRGARETVAPTGEAPSLTTPSPVAPERTGAVSSSTAPAGSMAPRSSPIDAPATTSSTAASSEERGAGSGPGTPVPSGGATLYGSVSLADGRPAVGAKVTAVPTSKQKDAKPAPAASSKRPSGEKAQPDDRPSTQVGADGRYSIEHLPPGRYLILATDDRHQDGMGRTTLSEGASERLDLTLKDGVAVKGHVRDPEGAALAGIHVSSFWPKREVVTGKDGRFEVAGFSPRLGQAFLAFQDPTGSFGTMQVLALFTKKDLVVILQPAARITGRVIDGSTEAGIEGASVMATLKGGGALMAMLSRAKASPTRSDAAGQFEIGRLEPGTYQLQVRQPDYAGDTATVEIAAGQTRDVTVRLVAGGVVTGRVHDRQTGMGIPGAVVADVTDLPTSFGPVQMLELQISKPMRRAGAAAWTPAAKEQLQAAFLPLSIPVTVTEEDGSFRLEHLSAGARQLVCIHRDHPGASRSVTLAAGQPAQADFALSSGGAIEGTVWGPDHAPVAGVTVQALAPARGARTAQTADDGAYTLRGLAPGIYMVMVTGLSKRDKAHQGPTMRNVAVKDGEMTRVDFGDEEKAPDGAVLVGTIALAGGPPKGTIVLGKLGDGYAGVIESKIVRATSDGSFRFEGVKPGRYELMIPPTYRLAVTVPKDDDEVRLDLRLPARTISGVVLGADGSLGSGATVTAVRASDIDDPLLSMWHAKATTDALGRFALRPLDTVEYEVEVTLPGKGMTRQRVSLADGDQTALELRLEATGTIRCHVLDPNGHPVPNVVLVAVAADGKKYTTAGPAFSVNPELRMEKLLAGTYSVWALSSAYAFDRQTDVRFDGTELTLELGLSPGGALELLCVSPAGEPVEGAVLELRLADGARIPSAFMEGAFGGPPRAEADGTVTRERLKAGGYQGTVRTIDGRKGTFAATIRDGETTKVTVTIAAPNH